MAQDDPEEDDPRVKWAEVRTDLAEDRNIMSVERTFAGWLRTALAAIGIGVAFSALFGEFDPPWLAKAIATAFIMGGAVLAFVAQRRACITLAKLSSHHLKPASLPNFKLLSYGLILGALLLVAGLWILNDGLAFA